MKRTAELPGIQLEIEQLRCGARLVCGVDEAGRGPLAGPVVAAAVVLPLHEALPEQLGGLNDSKQLSADKRRHYLSIIRVVATGMQVGMATPQEIDALNIRQASLLAMSRAVAGLSLPLDGFVLVDGRDLPAGLPCPGQAVVRGDRLSLSIAAASIVAKETRDGLMRQLADRYPGYGWQHNSGYPTAEHLRALRILGVTDQHRRTFAPVRQQMAGGFPL
ncbi:MAG: ribonuclease HII [Magnetococcus sp. MYC-9]